jgi:hypothetical protein
MGLFRRRKFPPEDKHAVTSAELANAPIRMITERQLSIALFAFVGVLTLLRVISLSQAPIGLTVDEAQYWAWSRSFEWGYFSKPPLVAWAIAATTGVFGNDPWAVRLAAPLAQGAGALILFALAHRMYGAVSAFWAGLGWSLMPGVALSASLITTDALLLPLWGLALFALWRFSETKSWRFAVLLGASIGLGALAKYAMLYFCLGMALSAAFVPRLREALLSRQGAFALMVAALILAPNIVWNAQHDFATVSHTAANANWGGDLFNLDQLANFLVDQFAVGGLFVIGFILFLTAVARKRAVLDDRAKFLLCFIAPPLLIVAGQALISRAHANWAASAYPALVVLIAGYAAGVRVRWAALAVHATVATLLLAFALSPALVNRFDFSSHAAKRTVAWDDTAQLVRSEIQTQGPFTAVLVDHRHSFFQLNYFWRENPPAAPLRMWLLRDVAGNHAEAIAPMSAAVSGRVLIVHLSPHYLERVKGDFESFTTYKQVVQDLGGGNKRQITFSIASDFKPKARDTAYLSSLEE